jgi:hypothetical protein
MRPDVVLYSPTYTGDNLLIGADTDRARPKDSLPMLAVVCMVSAFAGGARPRVKDKLSLRVARMITTSVVGAERQRA